MISPTPRTAVLPHNEHSVSTDWTPPASDITVPVASHSVDLAPRAPGGSLLLEETGGRNLTDEPRRLVRRLWESRKRSAFPPGALTFHLEAWTRRRLARDGAAAASEALSRLGFDEFLVLHGGAWLDGGGATLISGPAGIGKSSVLRELEADGHGRLVEDGLLLVGVRRGGWHLVTTGTHDLLTRASRISRRVRDLMRVDFCLYQNAEMEILRRTNPIRSAILFRLAGASFTLAAAFGPRPRRPFTPSSHEVRRLIVMPHPEDSAGALRVRAGGAAEEVAHPASFAPARVAVVSVSPLGSLPEVRRRLRQVVLPATQPRGG